jgi:hypothetical protein
MSIVKPATTKKLDNKEKNVTLTLEILNGMSSLVFVCEPDDYYKCVIGIAFNSDLT